MVSLVTIPVSVQAQINPSGETQGRAFRATTLWHSTPVESICDEWEMIGRSSLCIRWMGCDISCSWTGFKAGLIQLGIHAAWHVEGRSS